MKITKFIQSEKLDTKLCLEQYNGRLFNGTRILEESILEEGVMDTIKDWTNKLARKLDKLRNKDELNVDAVQLEFDDKNDQIIESFTTPVRSGILYLMIPAKGINQINSYLRGNLNDGDYAEIRPVNMGTDGKTKLIIKFADYKNLAKNSGANFGIVLSIDIKRFPKYARYEMDRLFPLVIESGYDALEDSDKEMYIDFFKTSKRLLLGDGQALVGILNLKGGSKFDETTIRWPQLFSKDDAEKIVDISSDADIPEDEQEETIADTIQSFVSDDNSDKHSQTSEQEPESEDGEQETPRRSRTARTRNAPANPAPKQEKHSDRLHSILKDEILDNVDDIENSKYDNLRKILEVPENKRTELQKEKLTDAVSEIDKILAAI